MLTRDSQLLWLAFLGAFIMYLTSTNSPADWTYQQWLQMFAFVIAWISGKLGNSPLKSTKEVTFEKSTKIPPVIVLTLVLVGMSMTGCSVKNKAVLYRADFTIYQSVKAISDTEIVLSRMGMLTKSESLKINEVLLPISKLGVETTQAIRAWTPGQPVPPQLPQLTKELFDIASLITGMVANPESKASMLQTVAIAQQTVLVLVTIMGGTS